MRATNVSGWLSSVLVIAILLSACAPAAFAQEDGVSFTGEILPVFYVTDVLASVEFYTQKLGFECHGFHDYETGETVKTWEKKTAAIYAGMGAGEQKFALHLTNDAENFQVGGMIHYFGVADVYAQHRRLQDLGVQVSEIKERPWMNMCSVVDPDGHVIYFFTRPDDWEE